MKSVHVRLVIVIAAFAVGLGGLVMWGARPSSDEGQGEPLNSGAQPDGESKAANAPAPVEASAVAQPERANPLAFEQMDTEALIQMLPVDIDGLYGEKQYAAIDRYWKIVNELAGRSKKTESTLRLYFDDSRRVNVGQRCETLGATCRFIVERMHLKVQADRELFEFGSKLSKMTESALIAAYVDDVPWLTDLERLTAGDKYSLIRREFFRRGVASIMALERHANDDRAICTSEGGPAYRTVGGECRELIEIIRKKQMPPSKPAELPIQ